MCFAKPNHCFQNLYEILNSLASLFRVHRSRLKNDIKICQVHMQLYTVKFLYWDHLWDCLKVFLKTSLKDLDSFKGGLNILTLIRGTLGVENEEEDNLNFANEVFNR